MPPDRGPERRDGRREDPPTHVHTPLLARNAMACARLVVAVCRANRAADRSARAPGRTPIRTPPRASLTRQSSRRCLLRRRRRARIGLASGCVVSPADSPRAFDDLGTLMLEVPGVTSRARAASASSRRSRCAAATPIEVRFFVDGVPLAVAAGGAIDLSTLPLGDVERVEIYRGTGAARRSPSRRWAASCRSRRARRGRRRVDARAGVGILRRLFRRRTRGRARRAAARLYLGVHGLSSRRGLSATSTTTGTAANPPTIATPAAPEQRRGSRSTGRSARPSICADAGTLSLGVIAFARDQGLPGPRPRADALRALRDGARRSRTLRYESRDDLGAGGRLHAQLFVSAQRDHFTDPGEQIGAASGHTHDTTLSTGADGQRSRPFAEWLRLAAVAEARARDVSARQRRRRGDAGRRAGRAAGRQSPASEATFWWRRVDLDIVPSVRVEEVQRHRHGTRRALPAAAAGVGARDAHAAHRAPRRCCGRSART